MLSTTLNPFNTADRYFEPFLTETEIHWSYSNGIAYIPVW